MADGAADRRRDLSCVLPSQIGLTTVNESWGAYMSQCKREGYQMITGGNQRVGSRNCRWRGIEMGQIRKSETLDKMKDNMRTAIVRRNRKNKMQWEVSGSEASCDVEVEVTLVVPLAELC